MTCMESNYISGAQLTSRLKSSVLTPRPPTSFAAYVYVKADWHQATQHSTIEVESMESIDIPQHTGKEGQEVL